LLVAGLLMAFITAGYSEALREPVVVQYEIGLKDWPAGAPPLRIVQLSDVHRGPPDMSQARLEAIVEQANALKPDLIVLTGDYHGGKVWDAPSGDLDEAVYPLRRLHARLGVIAVRGNHDEPYWTPRVFARAGIPLLQGRWLDIGPILVAGVDDLMGQADPEHAAARAIQGAPAGKPLLLLAHEPDFFQWLPGRIDLMLAGHSHGGQIRLPLIGSRSTGSPYVDRHLRGQFFEHGQTLIVSSGIGTSILPLRIGVPPEIVEVTLGPTSAYSVGRKSGTDR
jgi:predicted MPP superfamily phosphohydrolase